MSSPPHSPWFNHPNNIWWRIHRLWSSSLCNFLHDPSSCLLGPNIFLNTLFSKTLSLRSSPKVRDQVSHPYSITGSSELLENYEPYTERVIIRAHAQKSHYVLLLHIPSVFSSFPQGASFPRLSRVSSIHRNSFPGPQSRDFVFPWDIQLN
jgi:hypothetical protein